MSVDTAPAKGSEIIQDFFHNSKSFQNIATWHSAICDIIKSYKWGTVKQSKANLTQFSIRDSALEEARIMTFTKRLFMC